MKTIHILPEKEQSHNAFDIFMKNPFSQIYKDYFFLTSKFIVLWEANKPQYSLSQSSKTPS